VIGIGIGAFAVFALGLRHGADPDHLAAIDNLTRNSYGEKPWLSRFCGTLFAGGHTVMVLAIAALVGVLGSRFSAHGQLVETIGTWISIVVLITIAILNVRQLSSDDARPAGLKTRLLPKVLREANNPWVAVPVGLLFGFGFETSSQIATYTLAFGVNSGVLGALFVGSMFCLGMVCTDTLDSVLVHRLVSDRSSLQPKTMRVWVWSVTLVAFAVAGYELAQVLGWRSPVPDIYVSFTIVAALLGVFAYVFSKTHATRTLGTAQIDPTT
jgi:nickel/cobalt transporter (NiCoT) family protein